ncbi:MAG TPA: hypothetical protein DEF51_53440 [Myxococcales bacterium]|nr:hypothetical protein [Myxococcales bacterium]
MIDHDAHDLASWEFMRRSSWTILAIAIGCPFCVYGNIGLFRCDSGCVVAMCDECSSVWPDPRDLTDTSAVCPDPPEFRVSDGCALGPTSGWASPEEAERAGLAGLIVATYSRPV